MSETRYDEVLRDLDDGGPDGNLPATVRHLIAVAWEHVKDHAEGRTDGLMRASDDLRAAAAALTYAADKLARMDEEEALEALAAAVA